MIARHWNYRFARCVVFASALAAAGWLGCRPAAAVELDKLDNSLKLIPADAAFYSSMMRNREQIEAIAGSNAWAKIMKMPVVQMGLAVYNMQLGNPDSKPAQIEAVLKNPEMQKILNLLRDMASDEIFLYGDKNFVDFVELFQIVNTAQSQAPILAMLKGAKPQKIELVRNEAVISALAKNVKLIGVPGLVVGFKLKSTDLAKEELIKLEMFANVLLESSERTKGHFKKTKVGDQECLVLELDGAMIPWDKVPMEKLEEMEAQEGDAQKIIDRVKESKLVIALGVRGNYLLASIGPSLKCLEELGKGQQRLIDRAEFKPLAKYADKPLISIGYLSQSMNRQFNNQRKDIDNLVALADRWLPSAKLSDEQKERIRKDVQALAHDVKYLIPDVGAVMGLSFLADRGVEGYRYVWGENPRLDGSQPLSLLQHVGGSPIIGVVARRKVNVENYDTVAKWAKTGYGYFKEFGLPCMKDEEREKLDKFVEAALPLVERMDKANRELLIPALADGQFGLVLDDKLTSKQFCALQPETEKPMPMIEPAVVFGVSDAKLLKKGLGEYRAIINGLIDAVRQIDGSNVPEYVQIPKPLIAEDGAGTFYSFVLPAEWGVDKQIEPNIAVSDSVAVVSASRDHSRRLLKATPLGIGGVLGKGERPLAIAAWFNWAALVKAAAPWADFAADQAMAEKDIDEAQRQPITDQLHTALDVLKAVQTISNESYLEDGILVHHMLMEIQDVGK